MKTQLKIFDDPEPTVNDLHQDRDLYLNPNLDKQTLKEKFFLSKIPRAAELEQRQSSRKSPNPKQYLKTDCLQTTV